MHYTSRARAGLNKMTDAVRCPVAELHGEPVSAADLAASKDFRGGALCSSWWAVDS